MEGSATFSASTKSLIGGVSGQGQPELRSSNVLPGASVRRAAGFAGRGANLGGQQVYQIAADAAVVTGATCHGDGLKAVELVAPFWVCAQSRNSVCVICLTTVSMGGA